MSSSFDGRFDQVTQLERKSLKLKENCSDDGKLVVEGKVKGLKDRWAEVKSKIEAKSHVVEEDIIEFTEFMKEIDDRLTDLRNAEITLDAEVIGTTDLKVLENQLTAVKVLFYIIFIGLVMLGA